nr:hypothetical protein [Tanacetum cinerariifolium]
LEAAKIVIPEVEEIEDDNLPEKLLNVHLLIANIEALKDNPTQSSKLLTKSSSTSLNSFLEETNTFHNSFPEFENFYFDLREISSGRSVEDKILVPKLPKNYARCGHPVDGPYCQGCALLCKELEEDLVTHFQDFRNTFESSDDSTNVVNAPRESFVVKQDHESFVDKIIWDLNKAPDSPHLHTFSSNQRHCFHCKDVLGDGESCQRCTCTSPPHINHHCCYECGDALDGIFCQRCTCFDQTQPPQFPVIHPPPQETSIEILHDQEKVINVVQTFLRKFSRYSFFETPKVLLLAWDRISEIKDAFRNKQYKSEDIQELFRKLLDNLQNIHEELAEYINSPGRNRRAFYDDDDDDDVDYTIAITPVLSIEEPDKSLSIGDEHLDTIPATKSDEVIKSSVEDLVPIPSESEGISDTMCDVHLANNPTPPEAKDHFEIVINSNDDYSSSDDDYLHNENIEYVEESPHDSELVSLEVEKIVIPEDEEIKDDNLREKLLKVNLPVAEIEALKDNPTPSYEFLTKSSSTSPKSFLEETNTFDDSLPEFENFCFDLEEISSGSTTTHSDISLPDYEAFSFYDDHIKEISSGSTTTPSDISLSEYDSFIFDLSNDQFPPTDRSDSTHEEFDDELAHIISPPEYDCFYFGNLPDPGEWISSLNFGIRENLSFTTRVNLPELAVYINTLSWDRPIICYNDDDDEDYTIAITPILSTEEPNNSLNMRDEHLDTILETESDELIKSSVENLIPIPSESKVIPNNMYDVPFHDNSPPLDISKDQFEDFSNSNDDSTSIDDDSFSIDDIEYVERQYHYYSDFSLYDLFIFDLSINPFPHADRSDFYEFTDELAHIISPSEYDCYSFKNESNSRDFTMDVVEDIFPTRELRIHVHNKQEEKRIEEEQAAKARYWKIPACCDDDDDYDSAITPILSTDEPIDSLSMGDEHLDTTSATESDEVIKSSVENLVPIPSEFE